MAEMSTISIVGSSGMATAMPPGYFGFFANLVTLDLPASNAITRQVLGWRPLSLAYCKANGHYLPAC